MKSPTSEPAEAYTVNERRLSPRRRLIAAGSVALVFIAAALLAWPDNEPPRPLSRADIEELAQQMVSEQTEALRETLTTLTARVAQLSTQFAGQTEAFDGLPGQFADIEIEVAALKALDWTQRLKTAQASWQAAHTALAGRLDTIETQLKHQAKAKTQTKTRVRKPKTAAPPFHVAAIEYWGDTPYVTLSSGGRLSLLREGEGRQGWQFVGVDTDSGGARFVNGQQTRTLRVRR
jgi:uncharacterized protein YukE